MKFRACHESAIIASIVGLVIGSASAQSLIHSTSVATFEIKNIYTYDSDDSLERVDDFEPAIDLETDTRFHRLLRSHIKLVMETTVEPAPGQGARPEQIGAYLEELWITLGSDKRYVFAGKFTPAFGTAWDELDDLRGAAFAEEDYEFTEQLGIGGHYQWDSDSFGSHTLRVSTFFRDITALADSFPNGRARPTLDSGGPGNTGAPKSVAVALQGEWLPARLGYHMALSRRAPGEREPAAEYGAVAKVSRIFAWNYATFRPFVEVAIFDNHDGLKNRSRHILTSALTGTLGKWRYGLAFLRRETEGPDTPTTIDTLIEASVGYQFLPNMFLDIGWAGKEEDDRSSARIEFFIEYSKKF